MTEAGYEIRCNRCGAAVPSTAETCPECGTVLLGEMRPPPIAAQVTPVTEPARSAEVASRSAWARPSIDAVPSYELAPQAFGGFWIRVLAWFLDYFLGGFVAVVVGRVFGPIGLLAALPFLMLYYPLLESSELQATLGKLICGLAVTDTRGHRISFPRALGRYFAKFLSGLLLGGGFLMVAFTDRKRGLHDMIAGTLVLFRQYGKPPS